MGVRVPFTQTIPSLFSLVLRTILFVFLNYDVIEAKHTGAALFVNPVVAYGYAGLTPSCFCRFRVVYLCFFPSSPSNSF